ncbi:restriction endonuclease [Okeania sp. SIO2B3]|uniref:restriction endonuclease n=1 Tax=Okeania sp. SIO2B3 TaxID=2607784 RepID=UPI0025E77A00|nr:restriction endonuclease [Okeania sp. SIO2B3]
MNNPKEDYRKTFLELEKAASKFWPTELAEMEAELSIIPLLLKTQDQFLNILSIDVLELEDLFTIVNSSALSGNLFVKHLVIMADFGGEMLKRISREFKSLFPNEEMKYYWKSSQRIYKFQALPTKTLSNQTLKINGKDLFVKYSLDERQKDAIALLLFGNSYKNANQEISSILARCEIGDYLGKPSELDSFIQQRYIWVSRITGGAKSNALGHLAQKFVAQYIKDEIGISEIEVKSDSTLPNVTHTDPTTGRLTSFDIIVTKNQKYVAIEVSFQVTTNSVIERKGGQAKARYEQVEAAGHKIAYVIDGAGNFERQSALQTICLHSHCTVAFSKNELSILCDFLRDYLENNNG